MSKFIVYLGYKKESYDYDKYGDISGCIPYYGAGNGNLRNLCIRKYMVGVYPIIICLGGGNVSVCREYIFHISKQMC